MNFIDFLSSLKMGMVSPRLRGRLNEDGVKYSAETFKNFFIDKLGTGYKRFGIVLPLRQGINPDAPYYDPGANTTMVTLATLDFGIEEEITLIIGGDAEAVTAYGSKTESKFKVILPFENLLDWRASGSIDSGLDNLITSNIGNNFTRVSEKTYVVTDSNNFTISTITLADTRGIDGVNNVLFILPGFVNVRNFFANFNRTTPLIPILPVNYPFNLMNGDPTMTINSREMAGQTGTAPVVKELTKKGDKFIWEIALSRNFLQSTPGTSTGTYIGKFLILPSTDNSYDTVFLITGFLGGTTLGSFTYTAIQIVGGTPVQATSQWRMSTWGGVKNRFPKVSDYAFGRTFMGNILNLKSWYWVSGAHPQRINDFQCFMGFALKQDISASTTVVDVSKMEYGTVQSGDIDRFGFTDVAPIISPVNAMKAKKRMHILTEKGECQLQYESSFSSSTFSQIKVRSNSCAPTIQSSCEGDGKIFYISSEGIRAISVEDADYESQDELITVALEGVDIKFVKIQWFEQASLLIALDSRGRLFSISCHEDTQIKASTLLDFPGKIWDFSCGKDSIWISIGDKYDFTRKIVTKLIDLNKSADNLVGIRISPLDTNENKMLKWNSWDSVTRNLACDFYQYSFDSVQDLEDKLNLMVTLFSSLPDLPSITIKVSKDDGNTWNTYTIELPPTIPFNMSTLPFDPEEYTTRLLYKSSFKSQIITQPVHAGGGASTPIGQIHRVDRALIQVESSGKFKVGGSEYGSTPTMYSVEGMSDTVLKTRYCVFDVPQSSNYEVFIHIESEDITPLNISGISLKGVSYAGGA